ncbi:MAG: PilZ domain-containing protein [Acidobacteria bacterium]|nr:PilZ domain-containing protein [Acidobacteriota bacterium]
MSTRATERRSAPRYRDVEEHGIASVRVRAGHRADLVDLSEGGALVETTHRLLPGSSVELQIETKSGRTSVRGRVLRCDVSRLFPAAVWYRGAVQFDRHLPWYLGEHGYGLPAMERLARHAPEGRGYPRGPVSPVRCEPCRQIR